MTLSKPVIVGAVLAFLALGQAAADDIQTQISEVLEAQQAAWNSGDFDGYMEHILDDERTRHVLNGQVIQGYDAIRAGYIERTGGQVAGTISFSDLTVQQFDHKSAMAFARWSFELGDMSRAGVFTLIFERIDEQWVVTHDHTTLGQ